MSTFKERFKANWPQIKLGLLDFLKGKAVGLALAKFLGSAALGGFRAWLIKFLVENLYEQVAEPIIKAGLIKVGYLYRKHEGGIMIEKVEKAQENNNETDYNTGIDDILN